MHRWCDVQGRSCAASCGREKHHWSLAGDRQYSQSSRSPQQRKSKPHRTGKQNPEEIIGDIPAFASRPDDLIIPSSRYISTEIRRTKAKLANLQRLQGAVRELRRHKHLLQGLGND